MYRPNQSKHSTEAAPRSAPRRSRKMRTLLALGTIVGVGAVLTTAAFSDRVDVRTTFTAGSLDINVDGQEGNPTAYAMGDFTGGDDMTPGKTVVNSFDINNAGSLTAEVWVATSHQPSLDPDNPLEELKVQAFAFDSATETCTEADFTAWNDAGEFGDPVIAEADAISIDSATTQELCVGVHLPEGSTASGGGTSDALFRFHATS